jgi:hypothetical protein
MKKVLLLFTALFLTMTMANAATTTIENYDSAKLKQDIVKIYALNGASVNSAKSNEYTFSIRNNYSAGNDIYGMEKTFTIVQNGKDCILNLDSYFNYGFMRELKMPSYTDDKELIVLKKQLNGGYTYGLNYFVKPVIVQNRAFMIDGIDTTATAFRMSGTNEPKPQLISYIVPKSTIRGPKLISTSYSANKQGLRPRYRIVAVNGKPVSRYNPIELSELLNPTDAHQTIEVGYKESCFGKVKYTKLQSMYQRPLIENL